MKTQNSKACPVPKRSFWYGVQIQNFGARSRRAFTLLETVASLGILMVSIGASLTLIIAMLSYARQTEDMIVVVNLAREGIEVVRGIRDNDPAGFDALTTGSWLVDSSTTVFNTPASLNGANVNDCANCGLNLSGGQYLHTTGTATPYKRYIQITTPTTGKKQISSFVGWSEHGRSHNYSLTTVLYDWK